MLEPGMSVSGMPDPARPLHQSFGGIIAVGNLKGGVGKSTLAVGLAGAMARCGKSVVLVDADPQATSQRWLMQGHLPMVRLETLDIESLSSIETWLGQAERLVRAHGTVVIDLPAVIGPALASAFLLARFIVVPVSLSAVDIDGTTRVLRYIRAARAERSGNGPAVLIVPNKLPRDVDVQQRLAEHFGRLGEPVGPGLTDYPEHGQAFAAGRWIGDLAPESPAHREVMVLETAVAAMLRRHRASSWRNCRAASASSGPPPRPSSPRRRRPGGGRQRPGGSACSHLERRPAADSPERPFESAPIGVDGRRARPDLSPWIARPCRHGRAIQTVAGGRHGTGCRPWFSGGRAMLGGLMKKLFGGSGSDGAGNGGSGGKPLGEAVEHKGCLIQPTAMQKGGQYLTAGTISKEFPEGRREHAFVRADTHSSADSARDFAVVKGRQIIDEQGDRLFDNAT